MKGVDISYANGDVDFNSLKKAGIGFVIIRCGFGGDWAHQDDAQFEANVKKANTFSVPCGVYLYSYAKNQQMAQSEAEHVLRVLNGRKPAYGVWYDVEDPQISSCDLVSNCVTFCKAIEEAGLYCGIYSMLAWLENKLDDPRLDKYDKWVAQWNKTCDYKKPYGIWQYTDNLVIGGKTFDGNISYKDYPSITEGGDWVDSYEKWKEYMKKYDQEQAKKQESGWAESAVKYVCENGLMANVGTADNPKIENPQGFASRQELASVAMKIYDNLK